MCNLEAEFPYVLDLDISRIPDGSEEKAILKGILNDLIKYLLHLDISLVSYPYHSR